jgi:hypothetical protein
MQTSDPDAVLRTRRVQELCAQLSQLVSLSLEQRRRIDWLLAELESLAKQARQRPLARAAGSGGPVGGPSS